MKTKVILILILLITRSAFAEGVLSMDVAINLPNFETLKSMTKDQAAVYLTGLREAIEDVEDLDVAEGVEYEAVFDWKKAFGLETEAWANDSGQCIYGGFVQPRVSAKRCRRPDPRGCTGGFNFRCPIIYGNVCVGYGRTATKSCRESSPPIEKVVDMIRADTTGKLKKEWTDYATQIQSYCSKGRSRLHCLTLTARVSAVRKKVGLDRVVQEPAVERIPISNPRANPTTRTNVVSVVQATPTSASLTNTKTTGDHDGCRSIHLLHEYKCSGRPYQRLIEPELAYQAFCQGDSSLLNRAMQTIRTNNAAAVSCLQRETVRGSHSQANDQIGQLRLAMTQLNRCFTYLKNKGTIPSWRAGTMQFSADGTARIQFPARNGRGGFESYILPRGIAASTYLFTQTRGAQFCDYDIAGVSAPTSAPQLGGARSAVK